ncbi:YceI family protein [Xylophilus sp. GOD-11R]|uniref:YceI family protein n=1 Tax=Xylophilus sp. GOD-11R TaxID=3089814 RepID=UPI00298C9A28|nr:YceI family protein [Xylophilus sp. GOD-11R]WPB57465.1 YceI family protein [Xylophilus sp. GOD-11R]
MRHTLFALAAAATLATGVAHAEPATYAVDPSHTYATFEISHFGASVNRGRFDKKEGSVQFDKAAKTGKVELTIDMTSISTGFPAFEKHLQGPEIFDAAQFPTAKFVGDKFTFDGDKLVSVAGTMTIKGKTQPVTFKANQFTCYQSPVVKREVCGGDFETTIDRTLFGADYGVQFGIPKNVRIVAQIEAVKQ